MRRIPNFPHGNCLPVGQQPAVPARPSASRPEDGNAASIIAQGNFPNPAWLESGLPSRRDEYVQNCLRRAAIDSAQERLGVSQKQYVCDSVEFLLPQARARAQNAGIQISDEQIKQQLVDNAAQSWMELAAPHIADWESASDSEAYRQTQAAAEQTWNRRVTEHVGQLGGALPAGQPSSVAPHVGAASRAAVLRDAWAQSLAINTLAAEINVFDQAFKEATPGLVTLKKRRRSSGPDAEPSSLPARSVADGEGNDELAGLDLNKNVPPQWMPSTSGTHTDPLAPFIPDSRRNSLETAIEDTRIAAQRLKVGKEAERTIKQFLGRVTALNAKEGRSRIDENQAVALYKSQVRGRQKGLADATDPVTGEVISKGALAHRQKVVDPVTGEVISKNALAKRQNLTIDPVTGEVLTKDALAKRQNMTIDLKTGEVLTMDALAKRLKKRAKSQQTSSNQGTSTS